MIISQKVYSSLLLMSLVSYYVYNLGKHFAKSFLWFYSNSLTENAASRRGCLPNSITSNRLVRPQTLRVPYHKMCLMRLGE